MLNAASGGFLGVIIFDSGILLLFSTVAFREGVWTGPTLISSVFLSRLCSSLMLESDVFLVFGELLLSFFWLICFYDELLAAFMIVLSK